ncbi:hypothetical protein O0I10_009766 [Lichtheimia ornata]|uniref:Uncharacterized protein n=1 Tax=Lichtheimia ornata TaxID=688661 RepID=A0AAD7UXC1_9FUNG|nr:uncharacterized protein O0I10_009766 [Lichtheimia ornata]KAJ8654584.1 hypothetical protein O0I10_009766 [Lichtheimia ornata]
MSSKVATLTFALTVIFCLNNRDDPKAEHQQRCAVEIATRTIKQARECYGHSVFNDAFLAVLREDHTTITSTHDYENEASSSHHEAGAVDVMDVDEDIDVERAENEEDPQQNVDRNDEDGDQNDEGSFSPHMQTDPAPQWDHEDIWNQLMFPGILMRSFRIQTLKRSSNMLLRISNKLLPSKEGPSGFLSDQAKVVSSVSKWVQMRLSKQSSIYSLRDQLELVVRDDEARDLLKYGQHYSANDVTASSVQTQQPLYDARSRDNFGFLPKSDIIKKNMLQICVTPGPRTVDAISFLEPVLEELESIATDGFHVQVGSSMLRVKAHLVLVGGDMPAASKMAGLIDHTGYHGCRFCYIKGKHNGSAVIFPPEQVESDMREPPCLKLYVLLLVNVAPVHSQRFLASMATHFP